MLEYETVPVRETEPTDRLIGTAHAHGLSPEEAASLLRLNAVRPGFCQRTYEGIRFSSYCGIVRLLNVVLEILPKFGQDDTRSPHEVERSRSAFLTLLRQGRPGAIKKLDPVGQVGVRASLLEIFIESFLVSALEQARRGLLSRYMPRTEDLSTLKGRFNAYVHYRRNASRPHVLHCEYDDFTEDNGHNRAIRWTLNVCRSWIAGAGVARLWLEVNSRYSTVASVQVTAGQVATLPRDRATHRYDTVLKWCEWLLRLLSPGLRSGAHDAPGLLFDMNKLFESYVVWLERRAEGDRFRVETQGPEEALARHQGQEAFRLKPDITVWRKSAAGERASIVKIADAKWKRVDSSLENWAIHSDDIYQLVVYALHYGCPILELVYPRPPDANSALIEGTRFAIDRPPALGGPIEIRVKTVPLWEA